MSEEASSFFVYLLICSNNNSYVGATVDLDRRLRQHNGEIKGGAVATTRHVKQGNTWNRVCHVRNFPSWSSALQFEWRWKQLSRKLDAALLPLERRMRALRTLLNLESSTSKAIKYSEWAIGPEIVFEDDMARDLFNKT